MAVAYKCDRCGKLCDIPDIKTHIPIVILNERDIYFAESRNFEKITKLDLCEACNEKMMTWVNGGDFNGREVCTGSAEKRTRGKRGETRKADTGDTQDKG